LSRIVLIGEDDTISIFEETIQTEALIKRIHSGLWEPPVFTYHGPYLTIKKGNTLVVTTAPQDAAVSRHLSFSAMEMNILQGLATGLTDEQIAVTTCIKPRTVRFYITRLKKRLGAITREHLVAKAGGMGLFDFSLVTGEDVISTISPNG
jgi:DNA-binding CsgD family transcriptional regulator